MKNIITATGLLSISALLVILTAWTVFGQLNNSLGHNGQWVSTKMQLGMYVFGRDEFIGDRQALAHNHLNLAAWHGRQEVLTASPYEFSSVDFDFYHSPSSYFYFIFNKTPEQFSAVRLGNNPEFGNAFLTVKQSGEFRSKIPIAVNPAPNRWHHASIVLKRETGHVIVNIDSADIADIPIAVLPRQQFGFRGSRNTVFVDNVTAKNQETTVFSDSFGYRDARFLWMITGFLLSADILIFLITNLRKKNAKDAYFSSVLFNVILLVSLICIESAVWFYFLDKYPNPDSPVASVLRAVTFRKPTDDFEEKNSENLRKFSGAAGKKILVIGTSQAWGAGAEREQDTFANVIKTTIRSRNPPLAQANGNPSDVLGLATPSGFSVLNASIAGANSSVVLSYYKRDWIGISPMMVIIDLSNNDTDADVFRKNLTEFVRINNERHIQTVFVLEANSPEDSPDALPLHQTMREVGKNEDIRILDLHGYLKKKNDTGILWWDDVHMTTYGHRLAGEFIYEGVKDLLASPSSYRASNE